jgi:hypothetical protein
MFGNFISETCTGTTGDITLTGAIFNHIVFSEKFSDTDPVSYIIEDANGINKCGGVGVYNTANTITRTDSWTWNGTTYDDAPGSNLTLTGGTHTIRVSVLSSQLTEWDTRSEFGDETFRIYDTNSPTKEMEFNTFYVTAGQTRTLFMADHDIFLGENIDSGGNLYAGAGVQDPPIAYEPGTLVFGHSGKHSFSTSVTGFSFKYDNVIQWYHVDNILNVGEDYHIKWVAGAVPSFFSTPNLGLLPASPGILKITNGTTGLGGLEAATGSFINLTESVTPLIAEGIVDTTADIFQAKLAGVKKVWVDKDGGFFGIEGATITGNTKLIHTAVGTDEHALEIEVDAATFGDIKAIDIAYTTGILTAGSAEAIMLINIDETAATGGDIHGLEVITTEGSADNIWMSLSGAGVGPIEQLSGVFVNATSVLNIAVDVLTAVSSGGAGNISVFVADDDSVTIGSTSKFEEIEFLLDTGSSGAGISPTFEFSTGVGTWAAFTPIDGTSAFKHTGVIVWLDADIPTWAIGTGSEYLIRITRTENSLTTSPIVDTIHIAATTRYYWDKDGDIFINNITLAGTVDGRDVAADGTKLDLITGTNTGDDAVNSLYSGLVSNVTTDLTYTAATGVMASSDGTDATIPLATTDDRGLMSDTQFDKLAGIATSANVGLLASDSPTITGDWVFTANFKIDSATDALLTIDGVDTATLLIAGDTGNSGDTNLPDSRIIFSSDGNTSTSPNNGFEFAALNGAASNMFLFTRFTTGVSVDIMKFLNDGNVHMLVGGIADKFCMGDVTTPVATYGTAVSVTTGMSLGNTQTEIDKIRSALIAVGIIK